MISRYLDAGRHNCPTMEKKTIDRLFLDALDALGVQPSAAYYSPEDFVIRKGLTYRLEDGTFLPLQVSLDSERLQDAAAREGDMGRAKVYGEVLAQVLLDVSRIESMP